MIMPFPLAFLMGVVAMQGPGDATRAAQVSPFVGDEVAVVVAMDLTRVDPESIVKRLAGQAAEQDGVRGPTTIATNWVNGLKAAGARQLFALVDVTEMPGYPTLVAIGGDPDAVKLALANMKGSPIRWPKVEVIRGAVVAGSAAAIERLSGGAPAPRAEILPALEAAGDAPIAIAIVPSKVQRRALEESIPALPSELGGGDVRVMTQGLAWTTFSAVFEPDASLHAVFEGKNAESTGELLKLIDSGLAFLKKSGDDTPVIRPLVDEVLKAKPVANGNRITIDADLRKSAELLAIPIQQVRESARRTQCVNNLKQIGLAMHNFHATHQAFPAAYTTNAQGKPLLSWRVQILPFLDQGQSLYKEFHQDEPWDSEHNKTLIPRMPLVFACPSGNPAFVKSGKTTYLTPRGPKTIFPGADRITLKEITDGTSNTIFVVDASDDAAVIWTKPDDWEVPEPCSAKRILGHHPRGFEVGFADGSVRLIKGSVLAEVLKALVTRNGGEVIDYNAL